ncbi:hypothetical protein [Halioxenophilus aromaticivorans]|uniref:Tat pathway signal sequence domain protein n=1 Tax=Halioxenophilus aromaticivorans TaxID=1306992 RepID=A0AAV3U843_9ALTE
MDRRSFIKNGGLIATAVPLGMAGSSKAVQRETAKRTPSESLVWLDTQPNAELNRGAVWGMPWAQGELDTEHALMLINESGKPAPMQTWPMAYWPDGSVKWTGHAVCKAADLGPHFSIRRGSALSSMKELSNTDPSKTEPSKTELSIHSSADQLVVNTGSIQASIPKQGNFIIGEVQREGQTIAKNAIFVGSVQTEPNGTDSANSIKFKSDISAVEIEQSGPLRAVIKVTGEHQREDQSQWLPFTARLIFFAHSDEIQINQTFVYDGNEQEEFITGLGLQFVVLQRDPLYNRHVRFVGGNNGLWAESPKGITGLRRDPGADVRRAQIEGRTTPPLEQWNPRVKDGLHWIPTWNDYTLTQLSANGFVIRKRTKEGHAWIDADQGHRAAGTAYLGGSSGGVLFGMRDFWQLHPVQIDIRGAGQPESEATLWFWSPEAQPMDLRFYHDGLGQDTYEQQLDALNITYEDYEPGFGSPVGVARTTEITLKITGATPSRSHVTQWAQQISQPPQAACQPEYYLNAGVFGGLWSLPDRSTAKKAAIEDRLDFQVDYYHGQVDQRHWYGFWNYGDIMHTLDIDRHVWRYDVGGYAWDNSELSPDLWLWYSFLRTGSGKTFRLAEAMVRHTRDVDIYHLGDFKGLGTRHNVQHWGCSAKQLRISTAAYRRFHYYLTADDRTGDVLTEATQADSALSTVDPIRKLPNTEAMPGTDRIQVGTDWSAVAANWLTAWERTGDPKYRQWLTQAMQAIGQHPQGFHAGTFGYDINQHRLLPAPDSGPKVSHLSAVFGLVEINAELIQLIDIPEYKAAWLEYCRLYNASAEEQQASLGEVFNNHLRAPHSRLTAYAAAQKDSKALAKRAWQEFNAQQEFAGLWQGEPWLVQQLSGPDVLNPTTEVPWLSTNDAAQWGLAAIQNLALVGDYLD